MAVLKNGSTTSLRLAIEPVAPVLDPVLASLADELAEAKAALEALRDKIAADARQAELDRAAAHLAGLEEGRSAAQMRADERCRLLGDAMAAATAAWTARLDEFETLAVTLARAALAKLFVGSEDRLEQVAATIACHVAALRRAGATALYVHPALVADLPDHGLALSPDASLPADGCRIALKLGSADLSVERQWRAIDALLASLEAPR